ncbi:MAG: starch-binding protein [Treponema sp.]|nr:starch-binding protein [Treponema sp.]
MKKVFKFFLGAVLSLGFFSCSNSITEKNETLYLSALIQNSAVKYGSIVISNDSARALDLSTITSASVTVSGYGMSDVTGSVTLSSGQGSGTATVENIPVGSNRVVTLKSNVDGAVIRAVCDIASGSNDVTVNWDSTAVANVYYYLIKAGADVSSIESDSFSEKIPDVHPALFDAETFASDFKSANYSASSMTADDYISDYGRVTVNTSGCSGFKVQITDIASEVTSITSDSQSFSLKAYPGSWKVWVYDENNNLKSDYVKTIAVAEKLTSTVDIVHIEGGTPVTGKIIVHVPESLGYKYIWAWSTTSDETNYTGGTWPGKTMIKNGDYYDYTLDGVTSACVIFNKNQAGSTAGNGQTADLYITEGEWNYIGGASGTLDTTGASISSNFEKATVEESLSVNVTNPEIPMPPTVTCDYTDGEEISTTGTVTFTVTSENTALTSGTYTVGSKSGTLSLGTNKVELPSGLSAGQTISLSATVTNEKGTAVLGPISLNLIDATPSTPTRLGAFYERCATSFSIWSPTYSTVKVAVKKQGESDFTTYTCTKGFTVDGGYSDTSNIYGVTVMGDCNLAEYQFYINGKAVRDPYGRMVKYEDDDAKTNLIKANYAESNCTVSSYAGSSINIVVDVDSILPTVGSWYDRPALANRAKSVVYEIHVGDFTCDSTWGGTSSKKGKFRGFIESGTTYSSGGKTVKTGLDHLVELGVTHVQIMPMYDYATKVNHTVGEYYNWGYDPVNYNVPEDRFAMDPRDYEERIREVKDLVNVLHQNGIRVIMDVVYNHSFDGEMFSKITSKYYTTKDYSGCGNSIDVSNAMVSRMVRDSLEYWAETFNLDGFRFDLMGIYTSSAIGSWGQYLNNKYSDRTLLLYGEPYKADNSDTSGYAYANAIPGLNYAGVGGFAHKYRETLKGGSDDAVKGYIFNSTDKDGSATVGNVMVGLKGSGSGLGNDNEGVWTRYFTASPYQAVNYLSAHDNLCLYDKITTAGVTSSSYAQAIVKFGHGIITLSQGVTFIHGGDDFLRTKTGDTWSEFKIDTRTAKENSYMFGQGMNKIDWSRKVTYNDLFKYNKDLIEFKKSHDGFYNGSVQASSDGMTIYYKVADSNGTKLTCVLNPGSNITYSGGGTQVFNKSGIVNSSSTTCEGTGVTIFCSN